MVQAPSSQAAPLPRELPFRIISGTIGTGAYAFIRKAIPLDRPTPVIAVKFINKAHAFTVGRLKPKHLDTEILLHTHLKRHKNIIELFAKGEDQNWKWIAMELAEGGDLFDKIEADVGVGEDVAHFYFTQLINAIGYMHTMGVAHRDIKPENVLLSADGNLKLADFGLAVLFQHHGIKKVCKSVVGSPPYMAPEIVDLASRTAGYEPQVSDVWSCGIVLFVLLVGNTPWDEPTGRSYEFTDFVSLGGKGNLVDDELWARIPAATLSLLHGMLKLNAKKRFGLNEVRTHPWFTQPNSHLSSTGQAADPIRLATQMMENLRVDFNALVAARPRRSSNPDAMEIDASQRPSAQICRELDLLKISSTQPDAPMAESALAWERPALLSEAVSASQPLAAALAGHVSATQLSSHLNTILANDMSLSQFSHTPSVPLSRTQAARRFNDIVPSHTNARFVSSLPLELLGELVANALHRLGIPAKKLAAKQTTTYSPPALYLQVATTDSRGQGIKGNVVVEACGAEVVEVRFVKAKGDPLEWRRLFKKVCVLCRDAIVIPQ